MCIKVFPEGGRFVNITDPEGGPSVASIILEGGTAEKKLLSTLQVINGTALRVRQTAMRRLSMKFHHIYVKS